MYLEISAVWETALGLHTVVGTHIPVVKTENEYIPTARDYACRVMSGDPQPCKELEALQHAISGPSLAKGCAGLEEPRGAGLAYRIKL